MSECSCYLSPISLTGCTNPGIAVLFRILISMKLIQRLQTQVVDVGTRCSHPKVDSNFIEITRLGYPRRSLPFPNPYIEKGHPQRECPDTKTYKPVSLFFGFRFHCHRKTHCLCHQQGVLEIGFSVGDLDDCVRNIGRLALGFPCDAQDALGDKFL